MPLYEYVCDHCGPFTDFAKMADSAQPADCPECRSAAPRIISAPRLAMVSKSTRAAHERNEKSAHEPVMAKRGAGACSHSGPCNHGPAKAAPVKTPQRPWMLGH